MNLPNQLTIGRLFLTVIFVVVLSIQWPYAATVALVFFVLASITDYLDGAIARKQGLVTDFGKLMDPLVDKIMTASAFICLIPLGAIPAWAVILMISREFLITGLRMLASSKSIVLPAEKLGKHKTSWQIAAIIYFLLLLSLKELQFVTAGPASHLFHFAWNTGGRVMVAMAVALTLWSGCSYLWKNRALIADR